MKNRRLTLNGAAYALGMSDNGVRQTLIEKGKLNAWVYAENGKDLVPYKRGRGKEARIYIYEEDLPYIKQPLPPLLSPLPPGRLLTRKGVAHTGGIPGWVLECYAYAGGITAYLYDEYGVNLIPLADQPDTRKILFFLDTDVKDCLAKQQRMPRKQERMITLQAVAYALNTSFYEVRMHILSGELPAWVYRDDGGIERYQKKTGARHNIIFVKESVLRGFAVNQLPPPTEKAPAGEILLKKAAAAYLDMKPHRLQGWAEEGKIKAYVYDERGVNLVPLEKQTARRGRVLHFRKADLQESVSSRKTI